MYHIPPKYPYYPNYAISRTQHFHTMDSDKTRMSAWPDQDIVRIKTTLRKKYGKYYYDVICEENRIVSLTESHDHVIKDFHKNCYKFIVAGNMKVITNIRDDKGKLLNRKSENQEDEAQRISTI